VTPETPQTVEVVQIEPGEDLVKALSRIREAGGLWVNAVGKVDGAELSVARALSDETKSLSGRLTLVSLSGPAGGPYGAIVAAQSHSGSAIAAGLLTQARSAGVTVSILGGTRVGAALEELTRSRAATERVSSIPPPPVASGRPGSPWAAVATASGAVDRAVEEEESEHMPEFKDRVIHPIFGLCDVMVAKGERLKIRDVNGPHRLREIHLSVMKILPPVELDGVRVFRLVKRS
jgi:hypothetical protein